MDGVTWESGRSVLLNVEEVFKPRVRLVQTPVQRTEEKNVRGKMRRRGLATPIPAQVRVLFM